MAICPSCRTTDYTVGVEVPSICEGIVFWSCTNCNVDYHALPETDGWRMIVEIYAREHGFVIVRGLSDNRFGLPASRLDKPSST